MKEGMQARVSEPIAARYGFVGDGWDLFVVRLVGGLITSATCGIAWLLGVPRAMERRWVAEHVSRDGARFVYRSIFWENVKHAVLTWLLLAVTLGLAYPWVIAMRCAHERGKMQTAEGHALRFDGKGVEVIGLAALTLFGTILSFGLATPWLTVAWYRWITEHTLVEDPAAPGGAYRLRFDGTGIDYLVVAALNAILLVITLGLASSWTAVRRERWRWSSTSDALGSPSAARSTGARSGPTPAQWALVAGAGAATLLAIAVVGAGAVVIGSRYLGEAGAMSSDTGAERAPIADVAGGELLPEDYDDGEWDESLGTTEVDTSGADEEGAPSVPLVPSSIVASSELATGTHTYAAAAAFDGDRRTAWAESVEGPGRGEWIEARFAAPRVVRSVRLTTGYDKIHHRTGDLFYLNAHLRRVRLRFSDGTEQQREVGHDEREVRFDGLAVRTRSVRVVAEQVWEGTRWQDLSISEIWIEGE